MVLRRAPGDNPAFCIFGLIGGYLVRRGLCLRLRPKPAAQRRGAAESATRPMESWVKGGFRDHSLGVAMELSAEAEPMTNLLAGQNAAMGSRTVRGTVDATRHQLQDGDRTNGPDRGREPNAKLAGYRFAARAECRSR